MSTVQPNNLDKLLTLQEVAKQLAVSVEVLLEWNDHNILKPTITPNGQIGYTQHQLDQFLTIRQLMQKTNPQLTTLGQPSPLILAQDEHSDYIKPEMRVLTGPVIDGTHHDGPQKPPSLFFMLSFTAIFLGVTIAVFPQQGTATSRLAVSEKILSALPIQLKTDGSLKKNLHNEGESVVKEKLTAPALYAVATEKQSTTSSLPIITADRKLNRQYGKMGEVAGANSYASSGDFQKECPLCTTDADSAIDETGNIKGEAKTDTLASIVSGIDEIASGDTSVQGSTDATNLMLFLFMGGIIGMFAFQKQLAFPWRRAETGHSQPTISGAYNSQIAAILPQKALEIDQKTDGTVVLYVEGREHKISKPELNSESDQFIERLMELVQPDLQEIEYDSSKSDTIRLTTPLSRLVTRLGFVGLKRDLFFPRTSKNSVLFRKYLTQEDLNQMNLTTHQILDDLTAISS